MVDVNSAFNDTKIDYKVLLAIIIGLILFQVFLETSVSKDDLEFVTIGLLIPELILIGCLSIVVAKRHYPSKFAIAFYALAGAFFSIILGEILYYYFSIIDIDPFPSVADLFYFLLYPFSMIHLIININFYQEKCSSKSKFGMVFLAGLIISVYAYFAFYYFNAFNIDFFYGLIFVSGAACITSVGIYGAIVVRKIPLGRSWFLLVGGIVIGTIADVTYYAIELTETYTLDHVVNLLWYGSYLIIFYALYKHYKIM